jgi:hypothetical protein
MYVDFIAADKIAIFILTFFAGLLLAKLFKARGVGGCLTYVIALVVLVLIISALIKGYSYLFEQITYSLETYIYFNSIGIIGAIAGLLIGFMIFRSK